ncbi:ATPase [Methanobacterium sp. MZ-A1]|uniref:copper-translocating P-type ATPase n=1 Tax=Methanobacterium sp. MZ-A1 TaxID=1911685 RepID=UPI000C2D3BBD|nr:copper-translocating P-type ATPase [Methanobacterium sp. MZ-A1]AUB58073.1 ATPase [Methanobacterium sp. MZ-A1]MBW4256713.1 cadmium-translocating P-type ATPase [Methanobacterium sp. YSL]
MKNSHHEMGHQTKSDDHDGDGHDHHNMIADYKRRFWICLILTVPILILSPHIQHIFGVHDILMFPGDVYLLFALSSVVYFYGGYPFFQGIYKELKVKNPGMMTLVAVAITTAYLYSSAVVFGLKGELFFWELATLIDIMLLGHWLEMRSVMGASRALEELVKLLPSHAHKLMPNGETVDVPLEDLSVGDKVLIRPGEKIPVDGEIIHGETSIDESMLTGESNPVHRIQGQSVIGGSINGDGAIQVEIQKTGEDSFLSQVIKLVGEAQKSRSQTQNLADRFAMWLTVIALTCGFITLVAWLVVTGQDMAFSLERAVTVMVTTCPHALGLAIPLVVAVSTALAAGNGLLIRNRTSFENARNIDAVIFDKTGTLTQGKFGVTDIVPLDDEIDADEVLKYAASLEAYSEHPIARGLAKEVDEHYPVEKFQAIPGKGVKGIIHDRKVEVVSPGHLTERGFTMDPEELKKLSRNGKTVVLVLVDGLLVMAVALADIIRPESMETINGLKNMGIKCIMITGDKKEVAEWVSSELGLDQYFAEVLPSQKAGEVKKIQDEGFIVAMTGDGINDAPALAQADVGIAIGAGTDVALETADIILVQSNPRDVLKIIQLARSTYRKMVENLAWGAGYNIFAIPLAAGVLSAYGIILTPAMGAVLMSASTIIVAVNSRFLKMGR